MSGPNVLLIVWDTCRRDALEPYGAPAGASPVAADLARRGGAAPGAHAAGSWTLPSHAAMFTGLLPRELGLTQAPGGTPHSCREALEANADRLLARVFRGAGYATAGWTANLWVGPDAGFENGFDSYRLTNSDRHSGIWRAGRRARAAWAWEAVRARKDDGASAQREMVLDAVARLDEQPFFWFVNLNECHSPYLPPRPWNRLGPVERARAAGEARRHLLLFPIWKACAGGFDVADDALDRMRRLYAGAVRQMDDWLGDVLGALDAAGRLDDTLVVLTSDHGENFGEGGLLAHAFSVDERLTHVPLIAAGPGAERLADTPALADLPRRLSEIAAIVGHPYTEHDAPVAQWDPPGAPDDPRLRELAESWTDLPLEPTLRRLATPLTATVEGTHKLLLRGAAEEFYDLEADPLELAPGGGEVVGAEMAERLRRRLAAGAEGAGEVVTAQPSADEVAEIEDRMRMLGYM